MKPFIKKYMWWFVIVYHILITCVLHVLLRSARVVLKIYFLPITSIVLFTQLWMWLCLWREDWVRFYYRLRSFRSSTPPTTTHFYLLGSDTCQHVATRGNNPCVISGAWIRDLLVHTCIQKETFTSSPLMWCISMMRVGWYFHMRTSRIDD